MHMFDGRVLAYRGGLCMYTAMTMLQQYEIPIIQKVEVIQVRSAGKINLPMSVSLFCFVFS